MDSFIRKSVDRLMNCDTKIREATYEIVQKYSQQRKPIHLYNEFIPAGSIAEGCVLPRWFRTCADSEEVEIDCMWAVGKICNDTIDHIAPVKDKPGFVTLKYDQYILPCFPDHVREEVAKVHEEGKMEYLNPISFRTRAVEIASFNNNNKTTNTVLGFLFGVLADEITIHHNNEVTGTTACVEVTARKGSDHILTFSVDYVPCIGLPQWPAAANEWLTRHRVFPTEDLVNEIRQTSCHIVPKSSLNGQNDREWRYSFSVAEKILANARSPNQNRIYMIFKMLFYKYVKCLTCPEKSEARMPSFHIKTVMFWFCEEHGPGDAIWKDENMVHAIIGVIDLYLKYIEERFLSNYFMPQLNVLEGLAQTLIESTREMLKTIRECPLWYVPFNIDSVIMKGNNITTKCGTILTLLRCAQSTNIEEMLKHFNGFSNDH